MDPERPAGRLERLRRTRATSATPTTTTTPTRCAAKVHGRTSAGQRQWMAWEPMAITTAQPRSGNWGDNSANNNGPGSTSRWVNTGSSGATWRTKNCNNAYFIDTGSNHTTTTPMVRSRPRPRPIRRTAAAVRQRYPIRRQPSAPTTPSGPRAVLRCSKKYSGFMKFIDPTKSYLEPGSVATYYNNPGSTRLHQLPHARHHSDDEREGHASATSSRPSRRAIPTATQISSRACTGPGKC